MENQYIIEMLHITKRFAGIVANDDITLQLRKGEIMALLGENGAGKSTLMSVLFGLYQPDEGQILKNGQPVNITGPNEATRLGIGMVHQHFKLVEVFTVLNNIILGNEPIKNGILDRESARQKILTISKQYGLEVDPDEKIENLTVGQQQRVEILKMLYRENDILIFDEPTAVLTPNEISQLLSIMKNLASQGKSILFISHKLNEIMSVADRCTVIRKGKYVGVVNIADTNKDELSRMMVGHDVKFIVDKSPATIGKTILSVQNLNVARKNSNKLAVNNVSFDVHSGEIVAIAGIDGNGQSELIFGITGLLPCSDKFGQSVITLDGENITKQNIRHRNIAGISHIPEDRHKYGLVLDYSLEQNMVLQRYWQPQFEYFSFIKNQSVSEYSAELTQQYDVRCSQGNKTIVRSMSGGNQQKAIIGRELDREHKLLIAVQPTRGLDVGAIEYIHKQIVADRDNGAAVLLVSYELDEVMNLADTIFVMFEGQIVAKLDPKKTSVQELGLYMGGSKSHE